MIILFSLCIKLYHLASTPPLDLDEYGIYYNALSIAREGIDEWGKSYPLFFQSFGDYKLAVDIYLAALLFKLFEPSAFWLRFPSVIFSVLYIPTGYALLRNLTGQTKWALLGAFFISILPTGIFYSHSIAASISASFPIFASLTLFIIGFQKKTAWKYILASSLFLTIAIYAYPLAWILAPFLILGYSYLLFKEKEVKLVLFYAIFAVASIPILLQFFLGGSQVRLSNTSAIAFDRGPYLEMQQMRQTAKNDIFSKIFHNKLSTSFYILSANYLKHFNISYLVFDKTEPKIQISPYPPLYIVLLPFYLYGIVVLIRKRKTPAYLLLLYFLLIAPLPSAITEGAVHPKRYLGSLGLESILVVLALHEIQIHKKRLIFVLLSLLLIFEFSLFLRFFHGVYAEKSDQLFYAKARIIEKVAAKHWPESPLFYT
ncbi:glycosyltransferase family 39 protein, partial [Candidatus Woesebacteria bacterium]|nr:glycosyltransferase family 39 protein [Candidatus Woesebacteria bacterium]